MFGEMVPMACYNVKYLLGGSEKNVRETYIKCCRSEGEDEARKVAPRDLFKPAEEAVSLHIRHYTLFSYFKGYGKIMENMFGGGSKSQSPIQQPRAFFVALSEQFFSLLPTVKDNHC